MHAGQKKVANDIEKALKKEMASAKANEKKAAANKLHYYARLLKKNADSVELKPVTKEDIEKGRSDAYDYAI